jgi:AsmA protein
MKRFLLIVLALHLLAAAGIGIALTRLDPQSVRDHAAEAVRRATGKPLVIREMPSLSFMPLGIQFGAAFWGISPDGTVDPAGGVGAAVKSGRISVRILPLLSGRVVIDTVLLDSPEIRVTPAAGAAPAPEKTPDSPPSALPAVEIGELTVNNASLFLDAGAGQKLTLSKLDVRLNNLRAGEETHLELSAGISLNEPALEGSLSLTAKGIMRENGGEVRELSARYTPSGGIIPAGAGPLDLSARGDCDLGAGKVERALLALAMKTAKVELSGGADLRAETFAGALALESEPRGLLQSLGIRPPLKRGLELFKLKSPVSLSGRAISLGAIRGALDGTSIEGSLTVDAEKRISGELRIGDIDIDALTTAFGPDAPAFPPLPAPATLAQRAALIFTPTPALAASPPAARRQQAPPAAGKKAGDARPRRPESAPAAPSAPSAGTGGLPALHLDLNVASVTVSKLRFKDIRAKIRGQGQYRVEPLAFNLGTGGSARLSIDVDAVSMRCAASGKISDVAVGPLLQAAKGSRPVEAVASLDLQALSVSGTSAEAAASSLSGKGLLTARGIALNGVSILPKNAPAAPGGAPANFEQLTVPFTATNGIVKLAPVSLRSPSLGAKGQGVVRLPQRDVNFSADISLLRMTVPVLVSGPFSDLSYGLDGKRALEGLVKAPGARLDAAEDLGAAGARKAGATGKKTRDATRGAKKTLKGIFGR